VANLLLNPNWEAGFHPFRNDSRLEVARGWLPWWQSPEGSESPSAQRSPVYDSFHIDGSEVQRVRSNRASHVAGLAQQVLVAPGRRYMLSAECKVWSSDKSVPGNLVNPASPNAQIGIDHTGGTDPASPQIQWSEVAQPLGRWLRLGVTMLAPEALVTVYLRTAPDEPRTQQVAFWRLPVLESAEGEVTLPTRYSGQGGTQIVLDPVQPRAQELVEAVVTSGTAHLFSSLSVRPDEGATVSVTYKGEDRHQGRYRWRYTFQLPAAGQYQVWFHGDEGARLLALETITTTEAEDQLFSGLPIPRLERPDYRSVYVLLPPTADKRWLAAAASGSFDGRYTVGFSADDAGGGPASDRHVLGVNPHHWPEGLDGAWFEAYYPGTSFTAIVVESPEDLEYWLRHWRR
jgi:hypothetical protein